MILEVDFVSEKPIYMQIRDQIVIAIGSGELKRGEKLPTVRQMAKALGVNHMTVNKAYNILKDEGLIVTNRSEGTMVKNLKINLIDESYMDRLKLLIYEGLAKTKEDDPRYKKLEILLKEVKEEGI